MLNIKKKLDVLFLCQFFHPEYISSATLPFDTAEALAKEGYSVGALCGYPKEYNNGKKAPIKEIYKGITIRRLRYIQLGRKHAIGRFINYFSFTLSVALNFFRLMNCKAVIVYSNPPILPVIPAIANSLFKTKLIFVCYDVYPEMAYITNSIAKSSLTSKVMIAANRIIFKHITKVVALSNEMKAYLLEHRSLLTNDKIEVIPNWFENINLDDISKASKNVLFRNVKTENSFLVSYFGNAGICQDLDIIIEAIRTLKSDKDIKFLFAGHGSKMDKLKDIVKNESLSNVTILGYLHDQDFHDALSISDCFLLSLFDGLTGLCVPSKIYSYMIAGKPIIAIIGKSSDIAKDLINNYAGYVIEPGESGKLINIILELENNDEKKKVMGLNSKKVFLEKYTKEICTRKYISLIDVILKS